VDEIAFWGTGEFVSPVEEFISDKRMNEINCKYLEAIPLKGNKSLVLD
jgi:hypothetical protein